MGGAIVPKERTNAVANSAKPEQLNVRPSRNAILTQEDVTVTTTV